MNTPRLHLHQTMENTHLFQIHTHRTTKNAIAIVFIANGKREGFVVAFWVCLEHSTHTMMFNAHPTIFCFRVLGFLSSFWYVLNIPHTHAHAHTQEMMLYAHPTIFPHVLGLNLLEFNCRIV